MHLLSNTWVITLGIWGVIVAFAILFILICLLEKIHLDDFVPATGGEPLSDSPYFTAMNDAARRLGFTPAGFFVQSRGSRMYQAQIALWVSPEQDVLIQIGGGKTAGVPIKRTILYSVLSTNQIIQTQDIASVVDLSGLTDQKLLMHADMDGLLSCHRERIESCPEQKRIFSAGSAFSERQSILRMRAEEMARMGLLKFLNQQQTIYRYTLKGAWLQYQKGLRGQTAQAIQQADAIPRKRPGSA